MENLCIHGHKYTYNYKYIHIDTNKSTNYKETTSLVSAPPLLVFVFRHIDTNQPRDQGNVMHQINEFKQKEKRLDDINYKHNFKP